MSDHGLRRVGPNPWDFEYKPAKGQRIAVKLADGSVQMGTVTDFSEDKETGEIALTVQQFPDAPSWFDAVHDHCYGGDE